MPNKFKTHCSCGEALLILGSKKGAYCPKCDRPQKQSPDNPLSDSPLSELGKELISLAAGMNRVIAESYQILDPKKQCTGGCGKSFPLSELHNGFGEYWCSECYESKKETN